MHACCAIEHNLHRRVKPSTSERPLELVWYSPLIRTICSNIHKTTREDGQVETRPCRSSRGQLFEVEGRQLPQMIVLSAKCIGDDRDDPSELFKSKVGQQSTQILTRLDCVQGRDGVCGVTSCRNASDRPIAALARLQLTVNRIYDFVLADLIASIEQAESCCCFAQIIRR